MSDTLREKIAEIIREETNEESNNEKGSLMGEESMRWLPLYLFAIVYTYAGILVIVHAPSFALIGGLMMLAAGLAGGIAIAHPASVDTRPEGGDSTQIEAPFTSGAVAVGDGQTP